MARRYTITDGPSNWDLMVSLFSKNSGDDRRVVNFTLDVDGRVREYPVYISMLQREDGSGLRFNFEAYVLEHGLEIFSKSQSVNHRIKGYFSVLNRKGWLEVIEG